MKYYEDIMKMFWYYIAERHSIYKKKEIERLPPPWTEDRILRDYKFTNVRRELDRGTRFVLDFIFPQIENNYELIFNIIIYRLFNKIETIKYTGIAKRGKWNKFDFEKKVREAGEFNKVFTSAFVVSGYSMFKDPCMDKISRVCTILMWLDNTLHNTNMVNIISETENMGVAYDQLINIMGIGPFLAYQIGVDLSYHPDIGFGEDDFVVMGPGARRGIDWLFENVADRDGKNYEETCFWLRDNQEDFWQDYNIDYKNIFNDTDNTYLTVMSIENCLCEFQKYCKAYYGVGRPRNKYDENAGYDRFQQPNYMQVQL